MDKYLRKAKEILGNTKTLPVLPSSAQDIIASTTDEFVDLRTLANCIGKDPTISARIVGLANSAYYAQTKEIVSVEEAIIRVLGLDLTRGIAIGMACSSVLGKTSVTGFDPERFWQSSLTKSALSTSIAKRSTCLTDQAPLCGLAGLLANIGLLAAVAVAPKETQLAFDTEAESLRSKMTLSLGCDYRHITAALAELWTLPGKIQEAFTDRCDEEWSPSDGAHLQACLSLADSYQEHNLEATAMGKLAGTSQITKILGLSSGLEAIAVGQEKSASSIAEIAGAMATR